jgi:hypothetical protein
MTKRLLRLWGLLAVCGLVACQAAATPTLAPTAVPTATLVQAAPSATPVAKTPEEEKTRPTATSATEATPTTEASTGEEAEPPWQIPRVGEEDWTKGTAGAGLVVVEYSDFQ